MKRVGSVTILVIFLIFITVVVSSLSSNAEKRALLVDLSMNIDGGAVNLLSRSIRMAKENNYFLIVKINTYGGYLNAADKIVEDLINSGIRCVTWIPPGGKAVSAGALISLACEKIFMSSASVIGAAGPIPPEEKVVSYVSKKFKSLAEKHFGPDNPNVNVAARFVTENLTLTAEEAWEIGFALRAENIEIILNYLNITEYLIETPTLIDKIISFISEPVIVSALFTLGVLLIVLEVLITGFQGYVIAGIVLIALSLYGIYVIPIDLLILALLASAAVLLVIEIYQPGFGIFGIFGIILLALAFYQLYNFDPYSVITYVQVLVYTLLAISTGLILFIGYKVGKVLKIKKVQKLEGLIGQEGIAKTDISPNKIGVVHVAGEDWSAYSISEHIKAGDKVVVVEAKGLIIKVKKKS